MTASYDIKKIFELYDDWSGYMHDSWEAGKEAINFVDKNGQSENIPDEKERYVFNFLHKIKSEVQAKAKDLEISLKLKNIQGCDDEKAETFKKLFCQIMLNNKNLRAFQRSLDKVYDFGHAVMHVKGARVDNITLNEELIVESLEDPRLAFFDKDAKCADFSDGQYCGRCYHVDAETFAKLYPKVFLKESEDEVQVIDFWCKGSKKKRYIKLMNGQYKREDLINSAMDDIDYTAKPRMAACPYISYYRCVKNHPEYLEKKEKIDCEYLPLIFNTGEYVWDAEQSKRLFYPFAHRFMGAQTLINGLGSTTINVAKRVNADKWLMTDEHIQSPEAEQSANEIAEREGAIKLTGNLETIRREPPQPVPSDLLGFFMQSPQILQQLCGSYFDNNSAQIKAVSGVALDKLFNRLDLIQNNVIIAHLHAVDQVGKALQAMIPLYYHQERVVAVDCQNGEIETYIINKKTMENGIVSYENAILDIRDKYDYQVVITPSKRLRDQNAQSQLQTLYQILPQAAMTTIDLYVRSLDISEADVLIKRLTANMPPALLEYSSGKISYQEYQQQMQQHMAQQQQMQQQMMQNSPQTQMMTSKMQAEQAKAQAQQYRAQTEQYKAETQRTQMYADAHNDRMKNIMDSNKFIMQHANDEQQRKSALLMSIIDHIKSLSNMR